MEKSKAKHMAVNMVNHLYKPRLMYPAYAKYVVIKYVCTDYYFNDYIFQHHHN